ncbi:hypothetical protein IT413_04335 [Candidatus Peregrinibacteria bacterium]|nr:hypothetical protein [Candidatus Peregrinibacteria bacterium]
MAPAKTSSKLKAKSKSSSASKPKAKTIQSKPRQFTVRGLTRDQVPKVEPLIDDGYDDMTNVPVKHLQRSEEPQEMDVPPPVQIAPAQPAPVVMTQQRIESAPRMEISHVSAYEEEEEEDLEEEPYLQALDIDNANPRDTIKVKFGKFVQLVNSHDFADVVTTHAQEEIIMSTDLLTELAGSHDRREERKIPLVFLVGIAIGVVLTYIFFSK